MQCARAQLQSDAPNNAVPGSQQDDKSELISFPIGGVALGTPKSQFSSCIK